MKNFLFIFCCFFLSTMYAQTDMGTLQGEVHEKSIALIGVVIQIKGLELDTMIGNNVEGKYELQLEAGQYEVKTSYLGYEDKKESIIIKPNEVYKHISELKRMDMSMPFETPGEAIDDLYGSWIVACITIDGKKYRQRKQIGNSKLFFGKLKEYQLGLGRIAYNSGCNSVGSYWFKHIEDGRIEMKSSPILTKTARGCPEKDINVPLINAISKMTGHFDVQFIENDKIRIKNDAVEMKLKRE